jgi:hypothetical protein
MSCLQCEEGTSACLRLCVCMHAEVVTRVAGSLEAGLPGYPKSLFVEINDI